MFLLLMRTLVIIKISLLNLHMFNLKHSLEAYLVESNLIITGDAFIFPKVPIIGENTEGNSNQSVLLKSLRSRRVGPVHLCFPIQAPRERRSRGMRGHVPRGPIIKHFQWKAWQIASVRSLFSKLFFLNCWWKDAVDELINQSQRKSPGLVP